MLEEKMQKEIHKSINDEHRDVSIIIMHPNTFKELKSEVGVGPLDSEFVFGGEKLYRYWGLKIIRSIDVKANTFKVL